MKPFKSIGLIFLVLTGVVFEESISAAPSQNLSTACEFILSQQSAQQQGLRFARFFEDTHLTHEQLHGALVASFSQVVSLAEISVPARQRHSFWNQSSETKQAIARQEAQIREAHVMLQIPPSHSTLMRWHQLYIDHLIQLASARPQTPEHRKINSLPQPLFLALALPAFPKLLRAKVASLEINLQKLQKSKFLGIRPLKRAKVTDPALEQTRFASHRLSERLSQFAFFRDVARETQAHNLAISLKDLQHLQSSVELRTAHEVLEQAAKSLLALSLTEDQSFAQIEQDLIVGAFSDDVRLDNSSSFEKLLMAETDHAELSLTHLELLKSIVKSVLDTSDVTEELELPLDNLNSVVHQLSDSMQGYLRRLQKLNMVQSQDQQILLKLIYQTDRLEQSTADWTLTLQSGLRLIVND